ncbi:MAG: carbohydrate binding family 9 domain-containing protein, partial [Acidobacteria bacterium]|nr:carbohydrate binding family 9 domain-containing protein [Acidobacteriota bacterium]
MRLDRPLAVDGRLEEAVYSSVPAISDFVQQEPNEGAPATEKTEVWVFYDADNVYVVARCWESEPDRVIANEMRRDNTTIFQGNDNFAFAFDTFYDRRNVVSFDVNPVGGRLDGQVTNERQINTDWNPVWDLAVGRFEGGWTLETAVPFKSLRYQPGRAQIWGINLRRRNLWKNEWSFVTPIPNSFGTRGIFQASLAATLVGLEAPPGSKNLELKPYIVSSLRSDTTVRPAVANDVDGDVGLDVKYGLTQNLTADFTYNTDFAQVEADEQQINLTRFSLFFPEKREFFLENQGTFSFGGVATRAGGDAPVLFYSRRIGLNQGTVVPIEGGGRLTGRVGRFSVGVLGIRTEEEAASRARPTTFSVVRLKRDVLRRSSVGLMVTNRSVAQAGTGANTAYGIGGTFAQARFSPRPARNRVVRRHSWTGAIDYVEDAAGRRLETR